MLIWMTKEVGSHYISFTVSWQILVNDTLMLLCLLISMYENSVDAIVFQDKLVSSARLSVGSRSIYPSFLCLRVWYLTSRGLRLYISFLVDINLTITSSENKLHSLLMRRGESRWQWTVEETIWFSLIGLIFLPSPNRNTMLVWSPQQSFHSDCFRRESVLHIYNTLSRFWCEILALLQILNLPNSSVIICITGLASHSTIKQVAINIISLQGELNGSSRHLLSFFYYALVNPSHMRNCFFIIGLHLCNSRKRLRLRLSYAPRLLSCGFINFGFIPFEDSSNLALCFKALFWVLITSGWELENFLKRALTVCFRISIVWSKLAHSRIVLRVRNLKKSSA